MDRGSHISSMNSLAKLFLAISLILSVVTIPGNGYGYLNFLPQSQRTELVIKSGENSLRCHIFFTQSAFKSRTLRLCFDHSLAFYAHVVKTRMAHLKTVCRSFDLAHHFVNTKIFHQTPEEDPLIS